jgi:hypothetical protein
MDTEIIAILIMVFFVAGLVLRDFINDAPILFGKDEELTRDAFDPHMDTPPESFNCRCVLGYCDEQNRQKIHFVKQGVKVRLK